MSALSPLLLGYTAYRAYKDGGRRYFRERLGFYASTPDTTVARGQPHLWVHAASVGEIFTVLPLLKTWLAENRDTTILVTTGTPTGAAVLQQQALPGITHQYLPVDFSGACKRFVAQIYAREAWIVETEIWPWLYAHCERQNIALTIINGRLSDRTSTQSDGLFASSYRVALRSVKVLARSGKDLERFVALGVSPDNIQLAGNLKYSSQELSNNEQSLLDLPYVLAASTHSDEELRIATAWQEQNNTEALLVIVPRHPERGDDIRKHLEACGIEVIQRSREEVPDNLNAVYLADTLGELQAWYKHALGAFVGGSLITRGGHNMLEPARYACPVVVGPHTDNFDEMMDLLVSDDAIAIAQDENAIAHFLHKASLRDSALQTMGQRAQQTATEAQHALTRYVNLLSPGRTNRP